MNHDKRSELKEAFLRLFFASACLTTCGGVGAVVSIYSRVDAETPAFEFSLLDDSTTNAICYDGAFMTGGVETATPELDFNCAFVANAAETFTLESTSNLLADASDEVPLGAEIDDSFEVESFAAEDSSRSWTNELKIRRHKFPELDGLSVDALDDEIALDVLEEHGALFADEEYEIRSGATGELTHTMRRFAETSSEVSQASVVTPASPGASFADSPIYVADAHAHAVGSNSRGVRNGATSATIRLQ